MKEIKLGKNRTLKDGSMMIITGNHHWIDIIYGYELPENMVENIRSDHDYLSDDDFLSMGFVPYKGDYYSMDSILSLHNSVHNNSGNDPDSPFYGYDGYCNFSYFSGLLFKFSDDYDAVKVYYYYM